LKVDNHNTIHGYSASWQVSNSASNPVLTRVSGGASWEDQDTRVNIKATLTSGINVLSGNYTDVIYTGETYDLDDSYDPTTGVFTPREAGYYSVMASLQWDNGNAANTGIRTIALTTASGTGIDRHDEAGSGRMYSSLHTVIYCDGVTGYKIRAWQNSGSSHGIVGSSLVNHSVLTVYRIRTQDPVLTKIDGGASWGKTETCVKAERSNSTTISTANYSTVRYANSGEEFDENGEFVPTTGLFTPVEAGYYVVKATINWENTNTQVGERTIRLVRNDGTGDEVIEEHAETGSGAMTSSIHTIIASNGSDNFRIEAWQNSGQGHDIGGATLSPGCLYSVYRINEDAEILIKENEGTTWSSRSASVVKAKRTTTMSVSSSTLTTVSASTEDIDTRGEYELSTGVFTPSQAGYYVIMATVDWEDNNTNTGVRRIALVNNLNTIVEESSEDGDTEMTSSIHTVIYSDGTDSYRIQAWQGTGFTQNIGGTTTAPGCVFAAYRL